MGTVVVVNNLTLDGVTQEPGRPDEDARGGFDQGGWATPYADAVLGEAMGRDMARTEALLLGRRTYEDLYGFWPHQDDPFAEVLTSTPKYVASRTLTDPLPWQNSVLLRGDVARAVTELRSSTRGALVVLGSGELVRFLARHDLVDEYVVLIHPLLLGRGRRLFEDGPGRELSLAGTTVTTTGVIIATYRR